MKVETSHHVDASEPDDQGQHEYRYEYELFHFMDGELSLIARSYASAPEEVHFQCLEQNRRQMPIHHAEFSHPLFQFAVQYLRGIGKTVIKFLGSDGYESISSS